MEKPHLQPNNITFVAFVLCFRQHSNIPAVFHGKNINIIQVIVLSGIFQSGNVADDIVASFPIQGIRTQHRRFSFCFLIYGQFQDYRRAESIVLFLGRSFHIKFPPA